MKAANPTKFLGVPRVWEKMKDKIEEAGSKSGPIKKAIVKWAKNAALAHQRQVLNGELNYKDKGSFNYQMAHKLVLR